MTYYMAGEGRRLFGQTTPSELPRQVEHERAACRSASSARSRRGTSRSRSRPGSSIPALVCGNTVVLKPADRHAAARRALRRAARRRPGSRTASSTSSTAAAATVGDRLVRHPDVPRDHAHRLARDRASRVLEGRRRHAQARPSRARRQERDHRHGRRRPRPRGRRDPLVGVRHLRPALHRRARA